jgi:hypothetical protein
MFTADGKGFIKMMNISRENEESEGVREKRSQCALICLSKLFICATAGTDERRRNGQFASTMPNDDSYRAAIILSGFAVLMAVSES